MKAAELNTGDFIAMNYGALMPTGIIVIHGVEAKPEVRTSSGVMISEARLVVVGTRLDADNGPHRVELELDRDSERKGVGSWELLDKQTAGRILTA